MSIVEIIDADTGKLKRIDYWKDYNAIVLQSHSYSYQYVRRHSKDYDNEKIGIERLENC